MVIHLVKSQPPQPGSRHGTTASNSAGSPDNQNRTSGPRYFGRVDGGTMFGSVVIPVIGDAGEKADQDLLHNFMRKLFLKSDF